MKNILKHTRSKLLQRAIVFQFATDTKSQSPLLKPSGRQDELACYHVNGMWPCRRPIFQANYQILQRRRPEISVCAIHECPLDSSRSVLQTCMSKHWAVIQKSLNPHSSSLFLPLPLLISVVLCFLLSGYYKRYSLACMLLVSAFLRWLLEPLIKSFFLN